ncbi:MAG: DUF4307 domain-containing protein [Candidatus Nanopelagicales bacterium]
MSDSVTVADPATWPEYIRARYGVRARPPWRTPLLVVIGVTFAVVMGLVGWRLAYRPISVGVVGYETLADDRLTITFDVARRVDKPVECVLRARSEDGTDVAYATVRLPAATGTTRVTYDLATSSRAFVGELLGCGLDGPPPGVAGAQFRPGVLPPEQPRRPGP